MNLPDPLWLELTKLFAADFSSESLRKKSVDRYLLAHPGLSMALLKRRDRSDPLRRRYMNRLIETAGFLVAMILSLVALMIQYSAYELDAIFASPQLWPGFLALLLTTALFMALMLVWSFRSRSALNYAAYDLCRGQSERT